MNTKADVLCFGEVLWDNLPTGPLPGGAPMNVALHLKRFGINSAIASSIGNDVKGAKLIGFLEGAGMNTSLIQVHGSLPTSEVLVHLNEKNNATFEICEPVAWDDIHFIPELMNASQHAKAIVYGSLASRNPATQITLNSMLVADNLKIMDVNLRKPHYSEDTVMPLLKKANIVKLNDDELTIIGGWFNLSGDTDSLARKFYEELGVATLIVTKGEHGASLIHQGKFYSHPGYTVKVADTVGAGDAFLAGFLAAYFDHKGMEEALENAAGIGAFVATKAGAVPDYTTEEVAEFIAERAKKV